MSTTLSVLAAYKLGCVLCNGKPPPQRGVNRSPCLGPSLVLSPFGPPRSPAVPFGPSPPPGPSVLGKPHGPVGFFMRTDSQGTGLLQASSLEERKSRATLSGNLSPFSVGLSSRCVRLLVLFLCLSVSSCLFAFVFWSVLLPARSSAQLKLAQGCLEQINPGAICLQHRNA